MVGTNDAERPADETGGERGTPMAERRAPMAQSRAPMVESRPPVGEGRSPVGNRSPPVVHGPWRGFLLQRSGDLKIRELLSTLRARVHVLLQRDSLSEAEISVEEHGERLASVLTIHDEGHPRNLVEHDTP